MLLRRRFPRICCWSVTARAREQTCGTAVSPPAEKNSFAWNPSGFATSTHGMLWIAVL